jgi:hypothetical protein
VDFFPCVQRCLNFVTAVVGGCGPGVSPMIEKRLRSPPHEQQLRTSHLRTGAGPCITEWQYFGFASAMFLNLNTSLSMYLFCNSRIHLITLYSGHVCVYYASMLRCWHLVWILVMIDHPCLGVGSHTSPQAQWARHDTTHFDRPN